MRTRQLSPRRRRRHFAGRMACGLAAMAVLAVAACAPPTQDETAGPARDRSGDIDAATTAPSPAVVVDDNGRPLATTPTTLTTPTTKRRDPNSPAALLGEDVTAAELTVPPRPPDAGSWKFIGNEGKPVAFDACRTIHYRVRVGPGPDNAVAVVREALDHVEAATGLRFAYDGVVDEVPTSATFPAVNTPVALGDAFQPVTIGWAHRDETDLWAAEGPDTLGVGGPRTLAFEDGQRFTVSGYVLLVPSDDIESGFGPGLTVGNVLLHEIGHLVGLDHVADTGEVMHARLERSSPDGFGPGDRRGLWELGASRGCASGYLDLT